MEKKSVSHFCWLLLAVIQIFMPSSAQETTTSPLNTTSTLTPSGFIYLTLPSDVTVAVGDPVVLKCGVSVDSQSLVFTLYNSQRNYSLTCPNGHVEDISQALYGNCEEEDRELLAIWTIKGTSFSDNNTRVVCQQPNDSTGRVAILHVYGNGTSLNILIGCVIGGFFGMLLVFGLLFILLRKSKRFQLCFGGDDTEDDLDTIIK